MPLTLKNSSVDLSQISHPRTFEPSLIIGEGIYFAGYPLTQSEYTFSSGMISAVNFHPADEQRSHIVIEGSVTPGHSGGPIFVYRNKKVLFVGTISAELAHLTEELLAMRDKLSSTRNDPSLRKYGNVEQSYFQLSENTTLIVEKHFFNDMAAARELTEVTLRNLNTGKARVILLNDISLLLKSTLSNQIINPNLDFYVGKGEQTGICGYINRAGDGCFTFEIARGFLILHGDTLGCDSITKQHNKQTGGKSLEGTHLKFPSQMNEDLTVVIVNGLPCIYNDQSEVHKNTSTAILRGLYGYCYGVSVGKLKNNVVQYPVDGKKRNYHMSKSFFDKHFSILSGDRKESTMAGRNTAKSRTVPKSTIIRTKELDSFNDEIIARNKNSFFGKHQNAAAKKSSESGNVVHSLVYRSISKYHTATFESHHVDVTEDSAVSHVYYSVVGYNNEFIVNHFAGTNPPDDYEVLEDSDNSVYVEYRPTF